MKKALLIALTGFISAPSFSDNHHNIAFGHGTDQGGVLGFKYSINSDRSRLYASLGLLTYTDRTGFNPGYGIGGEYSVGSSRKSALGVFVGTVSGATLLDEKTTYDGAALTYNYYFQGFKNRGFILGTDIVYGESSNNYTRFNDKKVSSSLKLSYEW